MKGHGVDESVVEESIGALRERVRSRSKSRGETRGRKRELDSVQGNLTEIDAKKQRTASKSKSRERSLTPSKGFTGMSGPSAQAKVERLSRNLLVKKGKEAKKGLADRAIYDLKPKHLLTGKRGIGKTDRR